MKKAIILAFVLFACSEGVEKIRKISCVKMVISDAIPIQFWVDGCETFNQKEIAGINKVCFCQPFECDDNIRIQLTDDPGQLYFLSISDKDNNTLNTMQFNETSTNRTIINANFASDLDGLSQTNGGDDLKVNAWSWDSGGRLIAEVSQIGSDISNTQIIKDNVSGFIGNNKISVKWGLNSGFASSQTSTLQLYLLKGGLIMQTITIDSKHGSALSFSNTISDFSFTSTVLFDQIGMGVTYSDASFSTSFAYIYYFRVDTTSSQSIYSRQFSFLDENICDESVSLTISSGGIFNTTFDTPVSSWSNIAGSGADWSSASGGFSVIASLGVSTDALSIPVNIPFGGAISMDILITGNLLASSSHATIAFYKSGVLVSNTRTLNTQFFNNSATLSFLLTSSSDEIRIVEFLESASSSPITYSVKDSLKVYSTGIVKAYSDCVDVKSVQNETILINYSNSNNFAGIDSSDVSPDVEFNLRVPAIFFEEEFAQEQESAELSDNREISLSSQLKVQRLLTVGLMPAYMHKKTILALMHQNVIIDGKYWVKDDPYEKIPGNKRNPLKQYKCLLTQQDEIIRNIL